MRKLLLIIAFALGSYTGFGQIDQDAPVERFIIIEAKLMSQYIEYCYADSVVIGERYIIDEDESFTVSQEVYFEIDYSRWEPNNRPPVSFIRIEDIKAPHEIPTFLGYATWLNNLTSTCKLLI